MLIACALHEHPRMLQGSVCAAYCCPHAVLSRELGEHYHTLGGGLGIFDGGMVRWWYGLVVVWLGVGVVWWWYGFVVVWLGGGVAWWWYGLVVVWFGGGVWLAH